jgi:hypothetical protein
MINRLYCLLIIAGCLTACQKSTDPSGYTTYLIPKGAHYATENTYRTVNKQELHFGALFDSSCIYVNNDPKNNTDINKLYGFSDCGSFHQENSARVGWLWNGSAIELYAYCYVDSIRNSSLLGTVKINEPCELSIKPAAGNYTFTLNNTKVVTMKRGCTSSGISGYQLYPYFGGDEVAPHDVRIYIKDL